MSADLSVGRREVGRGRPGGPARGERILERAGLGASLTGSAARGRRPLRIGIDISSWILRRGLGRYTRELVAAMIRRAGADQLMLYIDEPTARLSLDLPAGPKVRLTRVPTARAAVNAAAPFGSRSLPDLWRMRSAIRREPRPDVCFFPNLLTWVPLGARLPTLVGVHDLIPVHLTSTTTRSLWWDLLARTKLRLALREACAILTVSDTSRREIADYLRGPGWLAAHPADRPIVVAPDAVGGVFRRLGPADDARRVVRRFGIPDEARTILWVGAFDRNKNLSTLLDAFELLCETREDTWLVLVGEPVGDASPQIRARVRASPAARRIVCTGYLADADLACAYNTADVLAFPSLAEGFGLPMIEAMACGAPVVTSMAGALPEVAGGAALLVDPRSAQQVAQAMMAVLRDPALRDSLRARGLARAQHFTWDQSADLVLEALHMVATTRASGKRS